MRDVTGLIVNVTAKASLTRYVGKRMILRIRMPASGIKGIKIQTNSSRCDLRVLDQFIKRGQPLGKILLVGITEENIKNWRLLAGISLTQLKTEKGSGILKGRRLIIFPPWDEKVSIRWDYGRSNESVVFNAHHISFDATVNEVVKYHAKGADRSVKSPIQGTCPSLTDGCLLGALLIQSIPALDRFQSIAGVTEWTSDEENLVECRKRLDYCIRSSYPVFQIPKLNQSPPSTSIVCVFFLTSRCATDRAFHLVFSTENFEEKQSVPSTERDKCWTASIKMDDGIFLNLMFRRTLRTPIGQFRWIPGKSMSVNEDKIIINSSFHGVQ